MNRPSNPRRQFLGGLAAAAAVVGVASADEPTAKEKLPVEEKELTTDVLIGGGGTAGAIAAIQAGVQLRNYELP